MTPLDLPAFSLTGPLPTGTTLLEASAGTGKTYAIAALAALLLAGPFGAAVILTAVITPAVAEQQRLDCTTTVAASEAALRLFTPYIALATKLSVKWPV